MKIINFDFMISKIFIIKYFFRTSSNFLTLSSGVPKKNLKRFVQSLKLPHIFPRLYIHGKLLGFCLGICKNISSKKRIGLIFLIQFFHVFQLFYLVCSYEILRWFPQKFIKKNSFKNFMKFKESVFQGCLQGAST